MKGWMEFLLCASCNPGNSLFGLLCMYVTVSLSGSTVAILKKFVMTLHSSIFTVLSSIIAFSAFSQNYRDDFYAAFQAGDTLKQQQLLKDWGESPAADAEYYAASFNYYVSRAEMQVLELGDKPGNEESLMLLSDSLSSDEPAGYLYETTFYRPDKMSAAYAAIREGIAKFPARLDLRFGMIYMYGQTGDWTTFTSEIVNTVHYGARIQHAWTWTNNEKLEDGKEFMLSSIQDYQMQLYDFAGEAGPANMKRIAQAILSHYPEHVVSLSNLGIALLNERDNKGALKQFEKAHKVDPNDIIVIGNLAYTWKELGDIPKAISFYRLMGEKGDVYEKEFAEEQIRLIR